MKLLENEFRYYVNHQDELVQQYKGKYIVIKDEKVIGSYDSEIEAINETQKQYELGTFIVHKCEAGKDNYTQTFHSRVVF